MAEQPAGRRNSVGWIVGLACLLAAGPMYSGWSRWQVSHWASQCRTAQRRAHWEELQRIAERWTRHDPRSGEAWMFLADAAHGLGDLSAAGAALRQVPESAPGIQAALQELALLEFQPLNHPREGEAICQRMLELDPREPFAQQCLIQYYGATAQRAKLWRQIRHAIDHQCEPPEAFVFLFLLDSLRIGNGVMFNDHWLEADPEDETFLVARALSFPESGDKVVPVPPQQQSGPFHYENAEQMSKDKSRLIESLAERFPGNIELIAYQLEKNANQGEVERIAELLSRAPSSAESDSRFWYYKGWYHDALEESDEAEAAYRKALEINPLDWNARNRLAGCFRKRNDRAEVERLTRMCDQARELQKQMVELRTAEQVTPAILKELADYARQCDLGWLAEAIDRTLARGSAGSLATPFGR